MLESLEKMNIKKMNIETPERVGELAFDPRRDISEEKWEEIKYDYLLNLHRKLWPAVAMTMSRVMVMGMQDKLPPLSEQDKREMVSDLYNNHRGDIRFAGDIKLIDPTMVKSDQLDWTKIREDLKPGSVAIADYNIYLERLVACKIVADTIPSDEPDEAFLNDILNRLRNAPEDEKEWYKIRDILAKTKLLLPNNRIDISPQEWEEMRGKIGVGGGIADAVTSGDLTILAAPDARIEDGKIVLDLPEKSNLEVNKNTIPEQRSF